MIAAMTAPQADSTPARESHAADEAIAAVEQQFAVMFTRVKSTMRDRAARVHPELQPIGYTIIRTLVRFGPARASVLAADLNLDKSIVSRQAKILEELGFIERLPDADDGRASFLEATQLAVEKVDAVRVTDQEALYDSLRDWQIVDLLKLSELLGKLNELGS
ncbi:MAG: hypothetical protein JWO10_338 [Microbacteriaceae bacterium]|nr:hypothetical protein [Microbacteriaceae bacterium]